VNVTSFAPISAPWSEQQIRIQPMNPRGALAMLLIVARLDVANVIAPSGEFGRIVSALDRLPVVEVKSRNLAPIGG
jgi:hypothetical protein